MIRRIFIVLIALIPIFVFAQKEVGSWKIYSRYTNITQLEQTPDKIYYVSGNSLYSTDKNTQENYTYTSLNKLTDGKINKIYYNRDNKYLVITYLSGNIDLLYDNGDVVNIPTLKDAVLTYSPDIIDVAFNENKIYLATKFGLVIYDDNKHQVITSGIYNKEISFVTCVGDYVVVDQNKELYHIHKDADFNSFANFTKILSGYYFNDIVGLKNNKMIGYASNKNINLYSFDFENNKVSGTSIDDSKSAAQLIQGKEDYYFVANNIVYSLTPEGVKNTYSTMPSELVSQTISIWDNPNDIWVGDKNGIANYNIENGNAEAVKDKSKPTSFTVDHPYYITSNANGKVFISNHGKSRTVDGIFPAWVFGYVNTIDGDKVEDATPRGLESYNASSLNFSRKDGKLYDCFNLVFDPEDPETYYLATYFDGVYKIKDKKQVAHYYEGNSTMTDYYGCRVHAVNIDKEGNLWCIKEVAENSNKPCLHILPAEACKKETTTAADWISVNLSPYVGQLDVHILICEKSNMVFFCDGIWEGVIVAYDTKGTYSDVSDDTFYIWDYFVDQDGQRFKPYFYTALAEDKDGRVWIGTSNGVLEITDPSKATDPNMTVKRLKLKNESGTDYSGYLLDGLRVLSIDVDKNNNKWLATTSNGVYYVDANGEYIYEHFTSDNSPLPQGIVYGVHVHPLTNSIFMGTQNGLVEYNPSSSPVAEDYSEVYAYPNPVKPDYTGWITIKGLMQNSNVKIVDAQGNTCYTCESQGGNIIWDGCDVNGNRVKAGVYLVYASQGEITSKDSPVAKIMVVN